MDEGEYQDDTNNPAFALDLDLKNKKYNHKEHKEKSLIKKPINP